MSHHCHALGCKSPCPPRWLMCRSCWSRVPADIQTIVHVAMLREPNEARRDAYLARALAFADELERRA